MEKSVQYVSIWISLRNANKKSATLLLTCIMTTFDTLSSYLCSKTYSKKKKTQDKSIINDNKNHPCSSFSLAANRISHIKPMTFPLR